MEKVKLTVCQIEEKRFRVIKMFTETNILGLSCKEMKELFIGGSIAHFISTQNTFFIHIQPKNRFSKLIFLYIIIVFLSALIDCISRLKYNK